MPKAACAWALASAVTLRNWGEPPQTFYKVEDVAPFLRAIEASPALQARQLLLIERSEDRLARTLASEPGVGPDEATAARAVAAMLVGLYWMLMRDLRARVLGGEPEARARATMRRVGERGLARLRDGIGAYGRRPPVSAAPQPSPLAKRARPRRRKPR